METSTLHPRASESLFDTFRDLSQSMSALTEAEQAQKGAIEDLNHFLKENPDLLESLNKAEEAGDQSGVDEMTRSMMERKETMRKEREDRRKNRE